MHKRSTPVYQWAREPGKRPQSAIKIRTFGRTASSGLISAKNDGPRPQHTVRWLRYRRAPLRGEPAFHGKRSARGYWAVLASAC
ncbi:BZ3500_MvSof-1268-A1-R1_Chr5-2g07909 [Microbotryum saponariae]|uniref:BZ3500_MvSof-1268-A1-R1_Chr5-2g07909 protein n=1 Tax=Microbotryum saponariae TaxID=289078 RepID=A0A2X0LKU6_9BASI|nr:BZ3500_MvSof-1268-A1-R1_Chr5-2g07909 [Microbotryum saponariae]SDA05778.1 BZ3501_MvSof-1269-A2-R1_Chr5-2g07731 [Microbotryum saponariae]